MLKKECQYEKLEMISYYENGIKEMMSKADQRATGRSDGAASKSAYLKKLDNLTQEETKLLNDLYVSLANTRKNMIRYWPKSVLTAAMTL